MDHLDLVLVPSGSDGPNLSKLAKSARTLDLPRILVARAVG